MKYLNPVLPSDYSDPDVIRVGEDFYMVASSFNHVPGVPVLHSKNLVEWEIINHVLDEIPFSRFDKVCHGHGAWAPSIRYRGGRYYCLIPFPDEGIFVSETDDPYGKWSPLRPLLSGKGYEDPCPIWLDGKCYVVFAFVKSRIGFNSLLAVFETDESLTKAADSYKIIYDGRQLAPKIEGPKAYRRGEYIYILAPAGGVSTGWQVALRSREIYGEYETAVILSQGDTDINGPHQGALVDLDDSGEKWAFMHFQDMGAYGRVVHLQPAAWRDGWVTVGKGDGCTLLGSPVSGGEYPVKIATGADIDPTDLFEGDRLSAIWQTPANRKPDWFKLDNGLTLNCVSYDGQTLFDLPQLLMQKVRYFSFDAETRCTLRPDGTGDEVGFCVFGRSYRFARAVKRADATYIEICEGDEKSDCDRVLCSERFNGTEVVFSLQARREGGCNLACRIGVNGILSDKFYAAAGVWTGAKLGIYARSSAHTTGSATFKYFKVTEIKE